MSNRAVSVYAEAMKRKQQEEKQIAPERSASTLTRKPTRVRDKSRDKSRGKSRAMSRDTIRARPRGKSRDLPTRDEIQGFSFSLRDQLRVKIQAEVPHQWHTELADVAQNLKVKKLELYRFILGEFLGKVRRQQSPERSHAASKEHQDA